MAFNEGDSVLVIAGKYRNRKGIIKRWNYGNAYTVEIIKLILRLCYLMMAKKC